VAAEAAHLAVARFHKPHGLKGEALVFPLTDEPETVLVPGRELLPLTDEGEPAGPPVVIERARAYHRQWLVAFRGVPDRTTLDRWPRGLLLGMPREKLTPPGPGQVYLHEIPGTAIIVGGRKVGVARDLYNAPGGDLLEIDVNGRALLVPFRRPIVVRVDREAGEIELDPPPGLLEL
jgi:16S rRNA processing protein RimM